MADETEPEADQVPAQQPDRAQVPRSPVVSSHLGSVGYDEQRAVLAVQFRDGELYEYQGVPMEEYIGLITAKSVGKYFQQKIASRYKYGEVK